MKLRRAVRVQVVSVLATVSVLAFPSVPANPAEAVPAPIDPALSVRVASTDRGVPAILSWDHRQVHRSAIADYLAGTDIEARVLDGLSFAFACAATTNDLQALASAPGAISVWGDHALEPALDRSIRTAFNGEPSRVWEDLGYTGSGVSVGVVDTGVDGSHPDLAYGQKTKLNVRVLMSSDDITGPYADPCSPNLYTEQLTDSEVTSGHGTHLASVAAGDGAASGGRYRGLAPGASVVGVGAMDSMPLQGSVCAREEPCTTPESRTYLSLMGVIAGMSYVQQTGLGECAPPHCPYVRPMDHAKVILAGWTGEELFDPIHPVAAAVRELGWWGINVVFPAGNEGPQQSDCSSVETCRFNPFAAAEGAIGVAATPRESDATLEGYSSRGDPNPHQKYGETFRYAPVLSAPGTGVVAARRPGLASLTQPPGSNLGGRPHDTPSADRRYVPLTGTSVSAAHVAGAIALMQEAARETSGCYLTAEEVTSLLRASADPMPGYQPWEAGAGALNVKEAVSRAVGGGSVPTDPWISGDPWMCPPHPNEPVPPIEEYVPTFTREALFLHRNLGPVGNLDAREGRFLAWDYLPPLGAAPATYAGSVAAAGAEADHPPEHFLTMAGTVRGDLDTIAFDLFASRWAQSATECPLGLSFQLIVDGVPVLDQDAGSNLGVAYAPVDDTGVRVRFAFTNLWEAIKSLGLRYGKRVEHNVYLNIQNRGSCGDMVWLYDGTTRPSGLDVNLQEPATKGYVAVNVLNPPPA
jgi:serine protease AprX